MEHLPNGSLSGYVLTDNDGNPVVELQGTTAGDRHVVEFITTESAARASADEEQTRHAPATLMVGAPIDRRKTECR